MANQWITNLDLQKGPDEAWDAWEKWITDYLEGWEGWWNIGKSDLEYGTDWDDHDISHIAQEFSEKFQCEVSISASGDTEGCEEPINGKYINGEWKEYDPSEGMMTAKDLLNLIPDGDERKKIVKQVPGETIVVWASEGDTWFENGLSFHHPDGSSPRAYEPVPGLPEGWDLWEGGVHTLWKLDKDEINFIDDLWNLEKPYEEYWDEFCGFPEKTLLNEVHPDDGSEMTSFPTEYKAECLKEGFEWNPDKHVKKVVAIVCYS
jgi:hypothetical protein